MRLRWLSFGFVLAVTIMLGLGYIPYAMGKGVAFSKSLSPLVPAARAATAPASHRRPRYPRQPHRRSAQPTAPTAAVPTAPDVTPPVCSTAPVVNCETGVFAPQFTDVSIPGLGIPLTFTRTYSSARAGISTDLGRGWTDNYDVSLSEGLPGGVGFAGRRHLDLQAAAGRRIRPARGPAGDADARARGRVHADARAGRRLAHIRGRRPACRRGRRQREPDAAGVRRAGCSARSPPPPAGGSRSATQAAAWPGCATRSAGSSPTVTTAPAT